MYINTRTCAYTRNTHAVQIHQLISIILLACSLGFHAITLERSTFTKIENQDSVALNPLVSLFGRLVVRSGRIRGTGQTDGLTVTLAAHARRGLIMYGENTNNLGAHAQRGLQYLVCQSFCPSVRPSVRYPLFWHYAQQGGQKALPTGSVPHWLDF